MEQIYSAYTNKIYIAVIERPLKACLQHVRPLRDSREAKIYLIIIKNI